jgi:hypothetical protein
MSRASILGLGATALVLGVAVASCSPATTNSDPVTISPQYYTVLLDTNRVRVLDYRLPSGQKEGVHAHPRYIVYFFQEARLRAIYPDGHTIESVVAPGETLYRDPLSHAIENIGDTEVHALLIELEPKDR